MILDRRAIEERERQILAPYAAKSVEAGSRRYSEPEHPLRTAFQRDRDRVIHSTAFRRLRHKTQVYVSDEGDVYRTRLTHTMETAQIARTIARALGLNEDLTEVLALAHDLGHPPFGHAGEEALEELMKEFGGFEHNLQSLRVVDRLERRYPGFPGLNLTWTVRESIRKHSVKTRYPIEAEFRPDWAPLLECGVADLADRIAYVSHDVDDALRAGLVSLEKLEGTELWQAALEETRRRNPGLGAEMTARQGVKQIIDMLVSDVVVETERRLTEGGIRDVADVRSAKQPIVAFSEPMRVRVDTFYNFLMANVYRDYRVVRMAEKGKRFLAMLFRAFVERPSQMPPQFQEHARDPSVGRERAVCDYLAGMTDRYAQEEVRRLFAPFEPIL